MMLLGSTPLCQDVRGLVVWQIFISTRLKCMKKRKMEPKQESKKKRMKMEHDLNCATALGECAKLDIEDRLA